MKRFVIDVVGLCLLVTLVISAYVYTVRSALIASHLSALLEMPVEVGEVRLGWDRVVIEDLRIPNKRKNLLDYTFQAPTVELGIHPWDLLRTRPVIEDVEIANPVFGIDMYESGGSDNNWQEIINTLLSDDTGVYWQYRVKRVVLHDIEIHACNSYLCQRLIKPEPIDALTVHDEVGMPGRRAIAQVARAIME
ncbi:MAG: hypothetical protein KDK78_12400, partial [Chlamydiia bacterium]|nr:hypothetical protein [Chlamydiia bacterium]